MENNINEWLDNIVSLLDDEDNVDLENKLLMYITQGNLEGVQLMIDLGATINVNIGLGVTPLIKAAYIGHFDIVSLLLDRGADVQLSDFFGETALITAAAKGHINIAKLLLEHGAPVNQATIITCETPLMYAARNSNLQLVELLLSYGADVDRTNLLGFSALNLVNDNNIVRLLKLGSSNCKDLVSESSGSYSSMKLALNDYFISPYISNIRRVLISPIKEINSSIKLITLVANRIDKSAHINKMLPSLPLELWRLIIQITFFNVFSLNKRNNSLCFNLKDTAQTLAKISPALSEHVELELKLTRSQPVALKARNTKGLVSFLTR